MSLNFCFQSRTIDVFKRGVCYAPVFFSRVCWSSSVFVNADLVWLETLLVSEKTWSMAGRRLGVLAGACARAWLGAEHSYLSRGLAYSHGNDLGL